MSLSGKQKHFLRGLAHSRPAIVIVGNAGPTDAVIAELDAALEHHELVKIKLAGMDKQQRKSALSKLCKATGAQAVQLIGHMGVLYRANQDPKITLP